MTHAERCAEALRRHMGCSSACPITLHRGWAECSRHLAGVLLRTEQVAGRGPRRQSWRAWRRKISSGAPGFPGAGVTRPGACGYGPTVEAAIVSLDLALERPT